MRVIIDTDAGVDDTLALVYAARSPEIKIEMLTTVSGNVPVREVTQNVLHLKELLGFEASVFSGADVPRDRKLVTAPEVHGEDGVGNYRKSRGITFEDWETGDAALRIVSAAKSFGKDLTVVSLGPMTNLANAISIDADAICGVGNVIQMGGVFTGYGNTTEHTEFNIFVDPEAAEFVLANGVKVSFVSLDLTEQLFMPRKILNALMVPSRGENPELVKLLREAMRYYINYHRSTEKLDGCYLHDPIATAAAVNPGWFRFVDASVSVETKGYYTSGMTIADFRKKRKAKNSRVAVALDGTGFLQDFTRKLFGNALKPGVIRKECLRQRFLPVFNNAPE